MINKCPYCDSLTSAIDTKNYCSHKGHDVQTFESNAYYFSQSNMNSGKHLSRFSIRSVYNGYQHYQVDQREHLISEDRFLVVNQGQKFEHEVDQIKDAEGIIVAFNPNFLKYYLYNLNHSTEEKLRNPFEHTDASLYFYENSYAKSYQLDQYLRTVISDIKSGDKDPIYFQQLFVEILDELVGLEKQMHQSIDRLKALKSKTREELYKRLSTAKDYIDANLDKKLSIEKISQISCLSPFHFLRSFSACYEKTPYQYILTERLKRAHFLVERSNKDIPEIIRATGFEHKRTFQRAYQKRYGITPYVSINTLRA